jgi:hypothetical protein
VGEDYGPVGWLERSYARKDKSRRANPSERELFQLIEQHFSWCKCQEDGTFNTKATSFVSFDDDDYDYSDLAYYYGIPEGEEPPKWIA